MHGSDCLVVIIRRDEIGRDAAVTGREPVTVTGVHTSRK